MDSVTRPDQNAPPQFLGNNSNHSKLTVPYGPWQVSPYSPQISIQKSRDDAENTISLAQIEAELLAIIADDPPRQEKLNHTEPPAYEGYSETAHAQNIKLIYPQAHFCPEPYIIQGLNSSANVVSGLPIQIIPADRQPGSSVSCFEYLKSMGLIGCESEVWVAGKAAEIWRKMTRISKPMEKKSQQLINHWKHAYQFAQFCYENIDRNFEINMSTALTRLGKWQEAESILLNSLRSLGNTNFMYMSETHYRLIHSQLGFIYFFERLYIDSIKHYMIGYSGFYDISAKTLAYIKIAMGCLNNQSCDKEFLKSAQDWFETLLKTYHSRSNTTSDTS